mmetsp:Transcript_6686/g.25031  ORF Transcript_6686/g.25031 Transcript_6686/m.25031 type:complete len:289 (-) Transcript_6686:2381-3247(-)
MVGVEPSASLPQLSYKFTCKVRSVMLCTRSGGASSKTRCPSRCVSSSATSCVPGTPTAPQCSSTNGCDGLPPTELTVIASASCGNKSPSSETHSEPVGAIVNFKPLALCTAISTSRSWSDKLTARYLVHAISPLLPSNGICAPEATEESDARAAAAGALAEASGGDSCKGSAAATKAGTRPMTRCTVEGTTLISNGLLAMQLIFVATVASTSSCAFTGTVLTATPRRKSSNMGSQAPLLLFSAFKSSDISRTSMLVACTLPETKPADLKRKPGDDRREFSLKKGTEES